MATAPSLFGPIHEDLRFELTVATFDGPLRVLFFAGASRLSETFRYDVTVLVNHEDVAKLKGCQWRDAIFGVERAGTLEHVVDGVLTSVVEDGAFAGEGHVRVRLSVEPAMALLRLTQRRRMLQGMSRKAIVTKVLSDARIDCEWRVRPEPTPRPYCRQENESDYRFITRLASEEGAHFFFERRDGKPIVVFTNDTGGYLPIDPKDDSLRFNEGEGNVSGEHVRAINRVAQTTVSAFAHAAYDYEHPGLVLRARLAAEADPPLMQAQSEVYDFPGAFDDDQNNGEAFARLRLEQLRSNAVTFNGSASCLRLAAGRTFKLTEHPFQELNGGLLVTSVRLEGHIDALNQRANVSAVQFTAVPADTPIHPAPVAKPAAHKLVAVITGGQPGDVVTDELGRVQVQFKWDREETCSCFMRMMSDFANEGEGRVSIHKVGAEVIVDHLYGDIDEPFVSGAFFNAREVQPLDLPKDATRSAWRERSIPRGQKPAFNEIAFENAAGRENVALHAQRNLTEHIGHDHTETIKASQRSTVGAVQTILIGSARSLTVGASEVVTIGKDRTETVGEKESVTVKQGRTHTVEQGGDVLHLPKDDREVNVYTGNHTRNVKLLDKVEADALEMHARYDIHIDGDRMIVLKQGDTTTTYQDGNIETLAVGKILIKNKDGSQMLYEKGNVTITAPTKIVIETTGARVEMADGKIAANADTEVMLSVNDAHVKISAAGIEHSGASIKSNATSGLNEVTGLMVKLN